MATSSLSSVISFLVPSKLNLRRPAPPSQHQQVGYRQLGWPKKTTRVLCLSTGFNVQVMVEDNEPEERLLGRFRREVMRAGVIQECKRRRFFENKQEEKKRKTREAAKRNRKRRPRVAFSKKDEAPSSKRDDDDEDNWEMPAGGIP